MNRIRKVGKQERLNLETRNPGGIQRSPVFLTSWLPEFLLILSCVSAFLIHSSSAADVVIGSKKFTESYVLGEIAKRTLTDAGIPAEHRQGMGGTIILWEALRGGQIDAYPEYTGTIATEILKSDSTTVAGSNSEFARKTWRGHDGSAGLQQYVRAGNATQRSATAWYSHNQRSPKLSRS